MTRRKTGSVSTTVGGILAGLDQAIFRSIPPAHELVRHARPDDAVPTGDGRTIVIPPIMPGDRGPFCVRLLDHEPPRPIGPPRTGVCNPDPRSRADDERRAGTEFEAEAPGRVEKVDAILSPPDIEGRREVAGTDGEPVIRAAPLPPAAPTPGAMVN